MCLFVKSTSSWSSWGEGILSEPGVVGSKGLDGDTLEVASGYESKELILVAASYNIPQAFGNF